MSTDTHWVGPFGILVPNEIDNVVTADGNIMYSDGLPTQSWCPDVMTEETYKAHWAIYDEVTEKWYYRENKMSGTYWVGAYGILVPNHITSVVAEDGRNTLDIDGEKTQLNCLNRTMTEEQYKKLYATYDEESNNWFYNEK